MSAVPPEAGVLAVAALLLAAGGGAKLARPDTTAAALRGMGLPVGPRAVRVGAATELALGLTALVVGGPVAGALVALSYAAFACFVLLALARGAPLATCACFGEADTPPTGLHVAVDLALAAGAALATAGNAAQPLVALDLEMAIGTGVAAYVTFLVLTALPRLNAP
jgi:hypothetical protein